MTAMTVVWVLACAGLSWWLRARPDVVALVILLLWVLVPAQASEVLTGVTFFAPSMLNLHPAAYLTYIYAALYLSLGGGAWQARLSSLPGLFLLLGWVVALAGALTLLQLEQASPRGYLGNFLAGALWLALCAIAQQANPQFGKWLTWTLLAAAAGNSLLSIGQVLAGEVWPYTRYREMYQADFKQGAVRTSGTTDHPLVLSLLLATSLPLVVAVRRVLLTYLLAVLIVVGLLQSGSRAGLVLAVLGFSAAVLMSGKPQPRLLALYVATAASGAALFLGSLGRNVAERFVYDSGSTSDRADAYEYLVAHLGEYLFFGGGYGSSFALKNTRVIPSSFENAYVMLAVDVGLIAALTFLVVQLSVLRRGWRLGVPRYVLWSAVTAMVTSATFSSFAVTSASMVLVWAPLAIVLASGATRIKREPGSGLTPRGETVPERSGTANGDGRLAFRNGDRTLFDRAGRAAPTSNGRARRMRRRR
jgi:hypothetical protein